MSQEGDSSSEVIRRIEAAARESPYPVAAFMFVAHGWRLSGSSGTTTDIGGAQLCWLLHDLALRVYGPYARERLELWGVHSCEDFGRIVYALIDVGLLRETADDSPDDFKNVFDFDTAFRSYHDPSYAQRQRQWRLSTLFVITTVCALAFAGFGNTKGFGPIGTLFSSWIAFVGFFCLVLGFRDRSKGWIVAVCSGAALAVAGCWMFLAIILN